MFRVDNKMVNTEHISHYLVFLLLTLNKLILAGKVIQNAKISGLLQFSFNALNQLSISKPSVSADNYLAPFRLR